jgi:LacI family transcriptional regulator, galactose operon repressor
MPQRITLRAVARRANVNVSTVSLALRNSPRLSERTRSRIQTLAKEMGYTRDSWLDALLSYRDTARRCTHPSVLAYVTSWELPLETIPHHRFYWSGARRRAAELGFQLEHFSLAAPGMTAPRLGSILEARGIGGIVLSSFARGAAELDFDWSRFSTVRIDLQPESPVFSTTAVDHTRAIIKAMAQAKQQGYRRPGFMLGHDWSQLVEDRWEIGFTWAQRSLGPKNRVPIFSFNADWKNAPRQHRFKAWFTQHRPDVLIGPYFHIEKRLGDLKLVVPRDVAVIDPFLETPHPFYAGIVHDFEEVGARAVENLVLLVTRNMKGIPPVVVRSYVEGSWLPGASCPPR